jgi:pimeloyl-ACP methyl ester carboxylesterase
VPQAGYASAYRAFAEGDLAYADGLGRIQCPLLALTGSDDANSTPTMTQTIAAQAANGRAVILSGHRHMVNLTAPLSVTTAMQAWLAETQAAV